MDADGLKSVAGDASNGVPAGGEGPAVTEAQHREAFDFAADAQLITDGRGVILDANRAASSLFRCYKQFLVGKPLALFGAQFGRSRFYESIGRLGHGLGTDTFEAQIGRRGEDVRHLSVVVRAGTPAVTGVDGAQSPTADGARLHWLLRDITDWVRSEAGRAELQRRLATAQEEERRRIARDLHDTTGQLLTAMALELRAVRDAGPLSEPALARLERVQTLVDELARQVHDLATRLRPAALDDLGLEAAARQLVADWSARTGVATEFQAPAGIPRFPAEVETVLYRVIQEALTNVARHAGAGRVAVVIGHTGGSAFAVVEDDGGGFDTDSATQLPTPGPPEGGRGHIGLPGMRERVTIAGGTLEIESAPGQGTTVIARVPLPTK